MGPHFRIQALKYLNYWVSMGSLPAMTCTFPDRRYPMLYQSGIADRDGVLVLTYGRCILPADPTSHVRSGLKLGGSNLAIDGGGIIAEIE